VVRKYLPDWEAVNTGEFIHILVEIAWRKLDTGLSSSFLFHFYFCVDNGMNPQTVCLSSTQFVEAEVITSMAETLYYRQRNFTSARTSISNESKGSVSSEKSDI
jgi:hypothetical protein